MHISRRVLLIFLAAAVIVIGAAYVQWAVAGLPALSIPAATAEAPTTVHGFPAWLRITHYVNLLLLVLLVRSGLQILVEHPRFYWNVDCTPDTEWLRLTPVAVPRDRVWTSKDDCLYLNPWAGLPGGRHTVGIARHWHFLSILFWVANGITFIVLLFVTPQWQRLVPRSWSILPEAWRYFVHYVTFHMPPEPDGFYTYNALQQLAYFGVVFVLAPLAILTGPSMSPALTARFSWYPRLPGNRQIGRSLHFLIMCAFVLFTIVHVLMVLITGAARNMNHIVGGTDDSRYAGVYLGLVGIAVIVLVNAACNASAWRIPRAVQHAAKALVTPIMWLLLDRAAPRATFPRGRASPFFWVNGKVPTLDEWLRLAADDFRDYRLKVCGLVEIPGEFSLSDLQALGKQTQTTLHHCIQGWSGIAEWGGTPLRQLLDVVRPKPAARAVVFYSYGAGGEGGEFYDSLRLRDARHAQTLLAYEMNGAPLPILHGAPLRLRVENQLGFKMVKWLRAIELVASIQSVGEGEGGYNEDHEYFGELANI